MLNWFEHSLDIILITRPDGTVDAANPAACAAFGMSEAQIKALGRGGLIDAGDPRLPELLAQREATGSARGELSFIRADGSRFHGEISSRVFEDEHGVRRNVMMVRDVGARYEAESALRASEARYRDLFEHLPAGIVVHGPEGQLLEANPRACEILGLSLDQMRGRAVIDPIWALLDEAGQPMAIDLFPVSRVLRTGAPVHNLVVGIRRPDRPAPAWGLCNAYPSRDDAGLLQRVVVSFVDVTDRVEVEASLRESEERQRLVLRGSNDAPWDWDLVHGEVHYADRWWEMLGYAVDELPADVKLWRRLLHPDDATRVDNQLGACLEHGPDAYEMEMRMRSRGGAYVPVLSRGFITRDAEGRAVRVSGVNTDLSERRESEAARRQLELQLRESQKMESIGTLAGGIAHDFNNLLGAILANAALAREDVAGNEPALQSIGQIEKAGQRARSLVEQILAFSRHQPPARRVQPLRPLVDDALSILRSTLPARVELATVLAAEPIHVDADSNQLQQVLMNLCTNAWHALQGGSGRITIGLALAAPGGSAEPWAAGLPPGRCAHLWVADTGSGIDAQTLPRIFEPFFTTKPVGQGTGLGLSVAHGIVTAHQGVIRAESEPGQGSVMHVYLPLAQAASVVAAAPDAVEPAPHGTGQLVAYVDDDEVMVHVVDRLLQRLGYRTCCFTEAQAALDAIRGRECRPDIVVSDYNMPGLSGLELAAALRSHQATLPVVISSGYISEDVRESAQRIGVRALMHKQNTLDELAGVVHRVLRGA